MRDTLGCLDKATFKEGAIPFHYAVTSGNFEVLNYIIKIIKEREILNFGNNHEKYLTFAKTLEFCNKDIMTPILLASKYNYL